MSGEVWLLPDTVLVYEPELETWLIGDDPVEELVLSGRDILPEVIRGEKAAGHIPVPLKLRFRFKSRGLLFRVPGTKSGIGLSLALFRLLLAASGRILR